MLSSKQREENITPIFIKGPWGAKELQTTKSDFCAEKQLVINKKKLVNHRHSFCGRKPCHRNILSSFGAIKNYVDTGEAINRVTEFPKPLMGLFAFFTSKVPHQSLAG